MNYHFLHISYDISWYVFSSAINKCSVIFHTMQITILKKYILANKIAGWAYKTHDLTIHVDGSYHVQTMHKSNLEFLERLFLGPASIVFLEGCPCISMCNNVVIKTSELTSLFVLFVSKLFHEVSLIRNNFG